MVKKIEVYDYVVYFKGGAGKEYFNCMREACKRAGITLVSLGYRFMGGISELPNVLKLVEQGQLNRILNIKSTRVSRTKCAYQR